jgi:CDP-diacylglycerol--glycerol-3-phosphate 3-phosphatidyltransferase
MPAPHFLRHVPNAISVSRLIVAASLLCIDVHTMAFAALYLYCGLSDVLDGALARRFHLESRLGARLDSAADAVFYAMVVVTLARLFVPELARWRESSEPTIGAVAPFAAVSAVIVIGVIRLASLAVIWARTGKPGFIHTYGNKASGVAVFFLPLALVLPIGPMAGAGRASGAAGAAALNGSGWALTAGWIYLIATLALAFFSAVEELAIVCLSDEIDLDRAGIWQEKRKFDEPL